MTGAELVNRFSKVTEQMLDTCRRKNSDYSGQSGNKDGFANFTMIERLTHGAISTETGMLTRMTDKYSRLVSLITSGNAPKVDESIEDTLLDLANYCILLCIYRQQKSAVKAQLNGDTGHGITTDQGIT